MTEKTVIEPEEAEGYENPEDEVRDWFALTHDPRWGKLMQPYAEIKYYAAVQEAIDPNNSVEKIRVAQGVAAVWLEIAQKANVYQEQLEQIAADVLREKQQAERGEELVGSKAEDQWYEKQPGPPPGTV